MCKGESITPLKISVCKKDYIWIPSTGVCEIDRCLKGIIGVSVVTCNEVIGMVAKS